jgi:uncharacterized protein (DUF58 family)
MMKISFNSAVIYGLMLVLLCFVAISCAAAEQELSVEAKVDKALISANEVMTLSVTVKGTMKHPPDVKMPSLESFDVISTSRAFNLASKRGKKRSATFKITYYLRPKTEGKFTIGSAEIEYEGKFYTTESIPVEIKPSAKEPEEPEEPEEEEIPKKGGFEIVI